VISVNHLYGDIRSYFDKGIQPGVEIGIPEIDRFVTWERGKLTICTGIPSHGKSSFVDFIVARLIVQHGWKAGFFTPENYPLKLHYAKLFELFTCSKFSKVDTPESIFDQALGFLEDHVSYILEEGDFTIDTILESAKYLVRTKGIRILVIDPYNKVEHRYEQGMTETMYVGLFLDKLLSFAQIYNCLVFLVAHPRKLEGSGGTQRCPTLYDISGSAHFYSKADYGLAIYRQRNPETGRLMEEVQIHVQKIRFKNLGDTGVAQLHYHYNSGRFHPLGESADKSNWIDTGPSQQEFNWHEIREETLAEAPF
jgi:twinkle protein